jgi:hypothetical protein
VQQDNIASRRRLNRIVTTLNELGYVVHEHALGVFKSYLRLSPKSDAMMHERELVPFRPLRGDILELWYPRLFQGRKHGQIANDYFRLFNTQACLIGNHVRWMFPIPYGSPFFMDEDGRVHCGFECFGSHERYPTLTDCLLDRNDTRRWVSVNDPEGTYDSNLPDLDLVYNNVRPQVLAFYDHVLQSLSWQHEAHIEV